jgi:hypothetical protein
MLSEPPSEPPHHDRRGDGRAHRMAPHARTLRPSGALNFATNPAANRFMGVVRRTAVGERTCDSAHGSRQVIPVFPVGLSDTSNLNPQARLVVPWGDVTVSMGRSDTTRTYPVGRSDETISSEQIAF